MSEVVIDIAKLVKRGAVSESHHIDCVMLEPLAVRALISLINDSRGRYQFEDSHKALADALEGALK